MHPAAGIKGSCRRPKIQERAPGTVHEAASPKGQGPTTTTARTKGRGKLWRQWAWFRTSGSYDHQRYQPAWTLPHRPFHVMPAKAGIHDFLSASPPKAVNQRRRHRVHASVFEWSLPCPQLFTPGPLTPCPHTDYQSPAASTVSAPPAYQTHRANYSPSTDDKYPASAPPASQTTQTSAAAPSPA